MLATTGEAQAHFTPKKFHSYSDKVKEYEHRKDHALDVERFFANHKNLARTKPGKKALREHKQLLVWSDKELAKLNSIQYLHYWSYEQLAEQAREEVRRGGTYSIRYGDCSYRLKDLSRELIERTFGPHGTAGWALHIVGRESGFCPGAVNTTYSSWDQRAQCIAQMIPAYHTWVDYNRCKTDPAYSVKVFAELSNYGTSTGPWG